MTVELVERPRIVRIPEAGSAEAEPAAAGGTVEPA